MPPSIDLQSIKIKLILVAVFLLPAANLVRGFYHDTLGANPAEAIIHKTGEWALRLLLLTLAVSPLRRIFKYNPLIHLRRMFGLLCFFYVLIHFSAYLVLEQWFDWPAIIEDIKERPYITAGFGAFMLLIPLAVTSTHALRQRLQTAWVTLHKLIYPASVLAILHFWWLVKADLLEPVIYASILALLLAYRLLNRIAFLRKL